MADMERRIITPEEFVKEMKNALRQRQESKYVSQVGLKDVNFTIDEDKAKTLGFSLPFPNIDQAEWALRQRVIAPTTMLEDDATQHQVIAFDPLPVGFSGFMDCVTHSLTLTDQGLFEVGRYPALSLSAAFEGQTSPRYWQWFLHRRLATSEQVAAWQKEHHLSPQQVVEHFFEALTGRSHRT